MAILDMDINSEDSHKRGTSAASANDDDAVLCGRLVCQCCLKTHTPRTANRRHTSVYTEELSEKFSDSSSNLCGSLPCLNYPQMTPGPGETRVEPKNVETRFRSQGVQTDGLGSDVFRLEDINCENALTAKDNTLESLKGTTMPAEPETEPAADSSDRTIERLNVVMQNLQTCGYYYENICRSEAKKVLKTQPTGTFLLRKSADPKYLFSLSVKTFRGPTSVRIQWSNDKYSLDCEDVLVNKMPKFDCVLKLIDFYVQLSKNKNSQKCVWLENSGRKEVPIILTRPLIQRVPTLQHACRTAIHNNTRVEDVDKLKLPKPLRKYLAEYPYKV